MSSCFSLAERRPQAGVFPSHTAGRRKCACGGQCSSCRTRQGHGGEIAHSFGDISVHGHGETDYSSLRSSAPLRELENGDTGCDVTKGVPDITLNKPSICYQQCTERHEQVHKNDIAPCCKKANTAWTNAKDDKKDAVQQKMNDWMEANRYWLECRAYAESVKCADEFMQANCGAKRSQVEQPGAAGELGDFPVKDMAHGEDQGGSALAVLAEGKSEDKPATDEPRPVDPARCCATVRDYRFHANGRREGYCKDAKRTLSPCPF